MNGVFRLQFTVDSDSRTKVFLQGAQSAGLAGAFAFFRAIPNGTAVAIVTVTDAARHGGSELPLPERGAPSPPPRSLRSCICLERGGRGVNHPTGFACKPPLTRCICGAKRRDDIRETELKPRSTAQLRRSVELAAQMTFVTDAPAGSSLAQPPLELKCVTY
jgi:hypothetical protein